MDTWKAIAVVAWCTLTLGAIIAVMVRHKHNHAFLMRRLSGDRCRAGFSIACTDDPACGTDLTCRLGAGHAGPHQMVAVGNSFDEARIDKTVLMTWKIIDHGTPSGPKERWWYHDEDQN